MWWTQTYADSIPCPACSSTPAPVMRRVEFSQQMIGVSSQASIQHWSVSQSSTLWWFQWWVYQTTQRSIFNRLYKTFVQNIASKTQTLWATTFVMTTIATQLITRDGPLWLAVLFQSRPILRDFILIQNIDSELSNIILDMWIAGAYIKTIDDQTLVAYNNIIEQYKSWPYPLRDSSSRLAPWSRYDQILTMLWRMNAKYKVFISTDNSSSFEAGKWYERNDSTINIIFASGIDNDLENAYSCVRWLVNKCSSQLQTLKENMNNIWWQTALAAKNATSQISNAFKRLKETMMFQTNTHIEQVLKDNKWYKQSSLEHRKSLIQTNIDIPNPFSTADKKSAYESEKNIQTDYIGRTEQSLKQNIQTDNQTSPTLPIISTDKESIIFSEHLSMVRDSVESNRLRDNKRSENADSRSVTMELKTLSSLVNDSLNIIGSPSQPWSINYNLKQSCENQCSNKPGICE